MSFASLSSIGAGEFKFDASADISAAMEGGHIRQVKPERVRPPIDQELIEKAGRNDASARSSRLDPTFDSLVKDILDNSASSDLESQFE